MPSYFILATGPIIREQPQPFHVSTLEEALKLIANHLVPVIDLEDDQIAVYELPEGSGRAELVWIFRGLYVMQREHAYAYDDDPIDSPESSMPQGKLLGHINTLYDELLANYDVTGIHVTEADRVLDHIFDNSLDLIIEEG